MHYTPFSTCVVILNVCCSTARREMATSKSLHTHTVNILKASTSLMLPRYITTCAKQNIHTLLPTTEFYPFLQLSIKLTLGMHEFPCHCTTRNVYALYVCHYRKPGMGRCPQSSPYSMSMPAGGPGMPLLKSSNYKPLSTSPIPT